MKPIHKLISFIIVGFLLFFAASWYEDSLSSKGGFIKLGNVLFHASIDSGINEAKNVSKPIFMYFRSETCYWCLRFEEEALSDDRVVELLNNNFVLVSIDVFEQKNVSLNLGVRSTPYMIFFTKDGEEIMRVPGYLPKEEFIVKLQEVMEETELKLTQD